MAGTMSRRMRDVRGRTVVQLLALVSLVAGTLVLLPSVSGGATNTFSNTGAVQLPRPTAPTNCPSFPSPNNSCPPTPALQYPSTISVSGMSGSVTDVNVTLNDVTYRIWDLSDLDVLLVAPNGTAVQLMSDACGDADGIATTTPVDFTFDDAAIGPLPLDATVACVSGSYQTTDDDDSTEEFPFTANQGGDLYCGLNNAIYPPGRCNPAGAPVAPASATPLSAFNGIDPNGTWSLYAVDDTPGDPNCWDSNGFNPNLDTDTANPGCYSGQIAGGWSLTITDNAVATTTTTEPTTTTSTSTTTTSTSTTTTSTSTTTTSTSTTTTAPVTNADLNVTISAADSIRAGRRTTISTMVRNLGPSTATNVTVALDLDDDFVVSRYSPSTCTLGAGNVLTCTYASLASGGKVSVKATGSYPAAAAGPNTNRASASSDTTDPVAGNNTASKTTGVVA